MKVSRNQYDAAAGLLNYGAKNGDKIAVSTSEYSVDVVAKWGRENGKRTSHSNASTIRGFAARGLVSWEPGYRCGDAVILDIDGLRAIVEADEII